MQAAAQTPPASCARIGQWRPPARVRPSGRVSGRAPADARTQAGTEDRVRILRACLPPASRDFSIFDFSDFVRTNIDGDSTSEVARLHRIQGRE